MPLAKDNPELPGNILWRIITKSPVLFPLVTLFHLLMLAYSIWNYKEFPFPSVYWIPVFWLLAYGISWFFVSDMRRWAAWIYLALTSLNILLHYALPFQSEVAIYTPPFLLLYVLFSFFVLAYYRRFR